MSNTIITDRPQTANKFDTAIHVAGLTVIPACDGDTEVAIHQPGVISGEPLFSFTPTEACALAAALQAVAVHLMEQQSEVSA